VRNSHSGASFQAQILFCAMFSLQKKNHPALVRISINLLQVCEFTTQHLIWLVFKFILCITNKNILFKINENITYICPDSCATQPVELTERIFYGTCIHTHNTHTIHKDYYCIIMNT